MRFARSLSSRRDHQSLRLSPDWPFDGDSRGTACPLDISNMSNMSTTRVARCPVTLFEAIVAGPWRLCPAIGELHMHEVAGVLVCQLHDLLDGQILFQTTRPPSAYFKLSDRFHIIKQENGTYRGFGFSDADAATEILDFVSPETGTNAESAPPATPEYQKSPIPSSRAKALFPFGEHGATTLSCSPPVFQNRRSKSGPLKPSEVIYGTSPQYSNASASSTPSPGSSPASVLAPSIRARAVSLPKETPSLPIPTTPRAPKTPSVLGTPQTSHSVSPNSNPWSEPESITCSFSPGKTKTAVKAKIQKMLSGGRDKYDGMEIGYPYNVQHEGHIGWTPPPPASESAWLDSASSSSFVSPPLSSFGSPGSDELGGNWIASTPPADFAPPAPPSDYTDELPLEEPSPVTPTKPRRTFSIGRRRSRAESQTLPKL